MNHASIRLHGFSGSNYYNKVKFVLLEKALPFEEVLVRLDPPDPALARSPLAKIPFIETRDGVLSESQVIVEYLEDAFPQVPLLPREAFAAARQRELITYMELHVELVARAVYGHAFFAQPASADTLRTTRASLEKGLAALAGLARFTPYLSGDTFGLADIVAFLHLPVVAMASRAAYGEDLVAAAGMDWKIHNQRVSERPAAQKVVAERKAYVQAQKKAQA